MTRIERLPFSRPIALLTALTALPFAHSSAQQGPECAMIELRIVWMDTIEAVAPPARCSTLRLVLAGPARYVAPPDGIYQPHYVFVVPVALENMSGRTLRVPIGMRGDSITAVQHGRQLAAGYSRPYHEMPFFHHAIQRVPWTFRATSGELRPGERSAAQTVEVIVNPLAQGLRLWFDIDRVTKRMDHPSPHTVVDTAPLPSRVIRFIQASRLPKVRGSRALLRMPNRDLVMFGVSYGEPHDCPAGCAYSSAIGLYYKGSVGWVFVEDMDERDRGEMRSRLDSFPSSALDRQILTQGFLDTLYHTAGGREADLIRDLVIRHPALPRSVLADQVERLYEAPDEGLGKLIAGLPSVRDDVDLLTLLAYLPYDGGKEAAIKRLTALIPRLVHDSSTPARTMFIVARAIQISEDTTLVRRVAEHPSVRDNTAILAALSVNHRELRPRMIANLHASPRVRAALAAYLATGEPVGITGPGRRLLEDPEAGTNRDVLLVLANAGSNQEIVWAASRRLPEEALRGLDYTYRPIR